MNPWNSAWKECLLRVSVLLHDWVSSLSLFTFLHWRRKWQPTPVFLSGESKGHRAWWAAISGVAQSWTGLKRLSSSSSSKRKKDFIFFWNLFVKANLRRKKYMYRIDYNDPAWLKSILKHNICRVSDKKYNFKVRITTTKWDTASTNVVKCALWCMIWMIQSIKHHCA